MSGATCAVCDYTLDERGRCAACASVLPADIERLKRTVIHWTVCSKHGAHVVGRAEQYRTEIVVQNPTGDKRKKKRYVEWKYRCPKCEVLEQNYVKSFKDIIVLPPEVYQPQIDDRLKRWRS